MQFQPMFPPEYLEFRKMLEARRMELYKALSLVRLEQDAHLASNYQGEIQGIEYALNEDLWTKAFEKSRISYD